MAVIRIVVASLLLAASGACIAAQPAESAERFLAKVATPDSDAAYDSLFSGSRFAEMKPQEIITIKSQTKMAMGLYGAALGVEKVEERELSPSVKRLVYIQKFKDFPVAWEFYFYKAKHAWTLNSVQFKDQVPAILDFTR